MKDSKKLILLAAALIAMAAIFILKRPMGQSLESRQSIEKTESVRKESPAANTANVDEPVSDLPKVLEAAVTKRCPEFLANQKVSRRYTFGRNVHYKKNGETYRARMIIGDGKEGNYFRVIFFKEDSTGFPVIESHKDYFKEELALAAFEQASQGQEILYQSQDDSIEYASGAVLKSTFENDRLVKFRFFGDEEVCESE